MAKTCMHHPVDCAEVNEEINFERSYPQPASNEFRHVCHTPLSSGQIKTKAISSLPQSAVKLYVQWFVPILVEARLF